MNSTYPSFHDTMYVQRSYELSRKRDREEVEDFASLDFGDQPRQKRHVSSLPLRQSPEYKKRRIPNINTQKQPKSPSLADITPSGSDTEDAPKVNEPKSFFSPWSSSPEFYSQPSTQGSPCPGGSQSTQMQDIAYYSDDQEMTDNTLLSPGPFQPDASTSIAGRIPTPINPQFASHVRLASRAPSDTDQGMSLSVTYSETQRSRRLPSPISEDERSPGASFNSSVSMHMDMEIEEPRETPRKGHTRSKHSLRSWGGPADDMNTIGVKRFSMGYRSDCEKCQKKVPGHFSHIVTY